MTTPRRRWFAFSLRTLFAVVTAAAALSWIFHERQQIARRRVAIETAGFSLLHGEKSSQPHWHKYLLGDDWPGFCGRCSLPADVDDQVIANLSGSGRLWHLSLCLGEKITDAGFANLRDLPQLTNLELDGTQITDAGLIHLKEFPQLINLSLGGRQVTDLGFKNLGSLKKLSHLQLHDTRDPSAARLTKAGWARLNDLPSLLFVDLSGHEDGGRFTDDCLESLTQNTHLNSLCIQYTQVTDEGLSFLTRLPRLSDLILWNNRITDRGLAHLHAISTLKKLNIMERQVTDEGISALEAALPNCAIRH